MGETTGPKEVIYCGVCSFPPEYCEFGGTVKRCKDWLEKAHPSLYSQLYPSNSDSVNTLPMSSLSLEKQEELDRKIQKQQAKEEAKAERELQKKLASKVLINRNARSKRKVVITIQGLEVFDIDIKKLSKTFASRFATGASVTKSADGKDEIVIQGDLGDEVEQYITDLLEEKGLTEVKVEQIEDKGKKKKSA
ncbi:uncharacterized protein SAPINGB_P005559 [Magnusiomyces paraingens]|uniref:Translation machinery-associated protein 22 n=1 Tax=Magnusiomyces paraingens TaxID=2606893 RepID=A0A5E8C2D7_9ASCO|nr:uncharacterized protein SAPINGB_P005559 [Saprochaete ingens]VVT57150.1 unnamed protein product [Saprochaete ingens]